MSDADRTTALADEIVDGLVPNRQSGTAHLLEVGIGERTEIADAITTRDVSVTAIDVVERSVPDGVSFRRADVVELSGSGSEGAESEDADHEDVGDRYADVDGIYALRLPPELHASLVDLATSRDVPAAFTTLGGDPPSVPARPQQLRGGETIFWVDA